MNLPEEFSEELSKSVQTIYREAIQQAQKDLGAIKEYLSIEEAMKLLQISRNSLTRNYFEHGLPKYKIGNKIYVKRSELSNFIQQHRII